MTVSRCVIAVVFGSVLFGQSRPAGPVKPSDLDISGVWNFATLTPLERPVRFATKPFLTKQEAAAFEMEILRAGGQPRLGSGPVFDEDVWLERGHLAVVNGRYLSSLVSDPPDGRIPEVHAHDDLLDIHRRFLTDIREPGCLAAAWGMVERIL